MLKDPKERHTASQLLQHPLLVTYRNQPAAPPLPPAPPTEAAVDMVRGLARMAADYHMDPDAKKASPNSRRKRRGLPRRKGEEEQEQEEEDRRVRTTLTFQESDDEEEAEAHAQAQAQARRQAETRGGHGVHPTPLQLEGDGDAGGGIEDEEGRGRTSSGHSHSSRDSNPPTTPRLPALDLQKLTNLAEQLNMPVEVVAQVFEAEWACRGVGPAGGAATVVPSAHSSPQASATAPGDGADPCEDALPAGAALQLPSGAVTPSRGPSLGAVMETPPASRTEVGSNRVDARFSTPK